MIGSTRFLAALTIMAFGIPACSGKSAEARNAGANALVEDTAASSGGRVEYPDGVIPSAALVINARPDPQPTHHTVADMLCPLIADGWSLTVRPATPNSTGNESRRQVNYVFTRSGDTPMVFITTRFEKVGKPAIEMLNEIKTADRNFLYEHAWPFLIAVVARDFTDCE